MQLVGLRAALFPERYGGQADYEDIPPDIMAQVKRIFIEECAKHGTTARLEAIDEV